MKDMCHADHIFGVKIQIVQGELSLFHKRVMFLRSLGIFCIVDCKPMCTPVATGVALSLEMFFKTESDRRRWKEFHMPI